MTVAVAIANIILGVVYCQYGTMTLIDMRRHWDRMGFSHFGAALLGYENSIVSADDLSRVNVAFFTLNGVISVVFLTGVLADVLA